MPLAPLPDIHRLNIEVSLVCHEIGFLSVEIMRLENSTRIRDMDKHDRLLVERRKLVRELAILYSKYHPWLS